MKFYCFPRKKENCVVYSNYEASNSKMFLNLVLQAAPKNSLYIRIRNTYVGHLLGSFFKIDIDVPATTSQFVGKIKDGKHTLVELINNEPKKVWRKYKSSEWKKEEFLGYQIITEYSLDEIRSKLKIIKKALFIHWNNLQSAHFKIHGDFTHFNILSDKEGNIYFIDQKKSSNSILFDFFYFYAYLKQCINRCLTLSGNEKKEIVSLIENLLKEVCVSDSKKRFINDYKNIRIPEDCGLLSHHRKKYLRDFYRIFL